MPNGRLFRRLKRSCSKYFDVFSKQNEMANKAQTRETREQEKHMQYILPIDLQPNVTQLCNSVFSGELLTLFSFSPTFFLPPVVSTVNIALLF